MIKVLENDDKITKKSLKVKINQPPLSKSDFNETRNLQLC